MVRGHLRQALQAGGVPVHPRRLQAVDRLVGPQRTPDEQDPQRVAGAPAHREERRF
jgi:hypothetical protein